MRRISLDLIGISDVFSGDKQLVVALGLSLGVGYFLFVPGQGS